MTGYNKKEMDLINEEYLRQYQEAEEEILAEITEFENDMGSELVFVDGEAKMKDYYKRKLIVKVYGDFEDFDLFVDGQLEVNIFFNSQFREYSCFDGIDGYGWHDTIKKAVKAYMDSTYCYVNALEDSEDYEPYCSSCGDGGCFHCEPNRFL